MKAILLKIKDWIIRISAIFFAIGLYECFAYCPRIDGGLRFGAAIEIAMASFVCSIGFWLSTTKYLASRLVIKFGLMAPGILLMPSVAYYFEPQLLWPSLAIIILAVYSLFVERRLFT